MNYYFLNKMDVTQLKMNLILIEVKSDSVDQLIKHKFSFRERINNTLQQYNNRSNLL